MSCLTHGIGGMSAAPAFLKLRGRLEMDSARREIVVRIFTVVDDGTEQDLRGRRKHRTAGAQPNHYWQGKHCRVFAITDAK